MLNQSHLVAAAVLAAALSFASPQANAAGEIFITHAKALAGDVTPGDTPGYPVTISIPGTFQLAGNLFVAANKIGIQVTSANVTIDLNGFLIEGSDVAWYGIVSGVNGVTIMNGTITRFDFDGIHGIGDFWSIKDVRTIANGRDGLRAGDDAHIQGSTSSDNGQNGVSCETSCLVERTTATLNDQSGIACGLGCHAEGNVASFNGQYGIFLQDGLALGNTVSRNVDFGITGTPSAPTAYGNNLLTGNNQGGTQAQNVSSLHANFCFPGACP